MSVELRTSGNMHVYLVGYDDMDGHEAWDVTAVLDTGSFRADAEAWLDGDTDDWTMDVFGSYEDEDIDLDETTLVAIIDLGGDHTLQILGDPATDVRAYIARQQP